MARLFGLWKVSGAVDHSTRHSKAVGLSDKVAGSNLQIQQQYRRRVQDSSWTHEILTEVDEPGKPLNLSRETQAWWR